MSKDKRGAEVPKGALNYEFPVYVDQMEPEGNLTADIATHAMFTYLIYAEKSRLNNSDGVASKQILLEDDLWMDRKYEGIAWGIAKWYGLKDPGEFLKYRDLIRREAMRLGVNVDETIMKVEPGMDLRLSS